MLGCPAPCVVPLFALQCLPACLPACSIGCTRSKVYPANYSRPSPVNFKIYMVCAGMRGNGLGTGLMPHAADC